MDVAAPLIADAAVVGGGWWLIAGHRRRKRASAESGGRAAEADQEREPATTVAGPATSQTAGTPAAGPPEGPSPRTAPARRPGTGSLAGTARWQTGRPRPEVVTAVPPAEVGAAGTATARERAADAGSFTVPDSAAVDRSGARPEHDDPGSWVAQVVLAAGDAETGPRGGDAETGPRDGDSETGPRDGDSETGPGPTGATDTSEADTPRGDGPARDQAQDERN
jgi:hypothetical protein